MKEQVKRLWEECFNDSKEFTDFYFEKRYSDDINIGLTENKELVSALQMIPYPMTLWGKIIKTSYISGACTSNNHRNQGMMRRLLKLTHERMFSSGVIISTLIPAEEWLIGFYEKSGYSRCFSYQIKELKRDDSYHSDDIDIVKTEEYSEEIYDFFQKSMMKRNSCLQHTKEDLKIIIEELNLENGILYVAKDKESISGLAFVVDSSGKVYLNELLALNHNAEQSIVNAICKDYYKDVLELAVPSFDKPKHKGMARIINVKEILDVFAKKYPEKEMYLEVIDDDISSNNGFYNIFLGECDCNIVDGKEYKKYSIKDLTNMLLDDEHPFMSLMLD